jgi:hypothetical protein
LIASAPATYLKPPHVGACGWICIEMEKISAEDLTFHIRDGWRLVAQKNY